MRLLRMIPFLAAAVVVAGCNTDMWRQTKHSPMDQSKFFRDGAASRPLLPGTIARGYMRQDGVFYTGVDNGNWVTRNPIPLTEELIRRGRNRFQVFCTPCHGQLGDGKGMIAQRGFELKRPVGNFHTERLRALPDGHLYNVMTNGFGAMYSYASRIEPKDRWAVVAYIRALQLSQAASIEQVPAEYRETVQNLQPGENFNPTPAPQKGASEH